MVFNQVSAKNVSHRGRALRAICAALTFVAAMSLDHWDGHVKTTDAATTTRQQSQVAVTIEAFDPSLLTVAAFAD